MMSAGAVPTIGPITGTNSPNIARIASGNAYGMRNSSSPMNVATPMIADRINCPESQALIRRAMRSSVRRRLARVSAGQKRRMRFRNRCASSSM